MIGLTVLAVLAALSSVSDAFLQPSSAVTRPGRQSLASTPLQSPSLSADYDKSIVHDEEESSLDAAEKFDWFKTWYPMVPVDILDPEKPHKFQLLGMSIVVWKDSPMTGVTEFGPKPKRGRKRNDSQGTWRAFVDECPHRKVPLSEGRVEADGSLLCSYHGWRFNGQGDLLDIPQANTPDELQRVKANPKSQCNSFPVQIIDGLLWLWPETGSDARIESALTQVEHYQVPNEKAKGGVWYGAWNYRELPYGADYFIENVVDPAHAGVSHHNIIGSRYGKFKIGTMKRSTKLTKKGFQITMGDEMGPSTTFHAPGHVAVETGVPGGALQTLELYASPSRPGFCNHVGRMVIVKDKDGKMPQLLRMFTLPLPTWVNHVMASFFLNQDALFLHHQERYLSTTGDYTSLKNTPNFSADHYNKAVLPVETDVGVVNFRNWLRIFAGGRIPYKYNPIMPEANNDIVFDVWNAHTKYCHKCQTALKNIKRVRLASFFAATCLAALRPATSNALNLVSVLATAGLGFALNKLAGLFYRYEFSHAHND